MSKGKVLDPKVGYYKDSTYLKIPHGKGCSFSLFDSSKLFNWTFSPEALNVSESMDVSWYILLSLRLLKTYIPRKESAPERAKKCFIKSWPKYIICISHVLKPLWVQKGIWILFPEVESFSKGVLVKWGQRKSFLLQRGRSIIRPTFSQKQLIDELSHKLVLQSVFCPSLDIDILYVFICLHPDWLT